MQVAGLSGVVAVAAGYGHTVALGSDGRVWAWGDNSEGQLGDGSTAQSGSPVQVAGLSGVVAVAAGYGHTVALGSDERVWTWGANYSGQLGDGSTPQRSSPVQVLGLSSATLRSSSPSACPRQANLSDK